jgi:hypothetical protein
MPPRIHFGTGYGMLVHLAMLKRLKLNFVRPVSLKI